ncbi:MAG: T9SS type A sorting domain-containing protein [Cryomorphaceae bacterium]|nr:T9SS type A sorting domain-containing protein [Cryomorphaceae bacterium]
MKKLLFSLSALVGFGVAFAQTPSYDLSLDILQPTSGATINSGQSFTIEFEVTNSGPDAIPTGDTIDVIPLAGGNPFLNQQGNPVLLRQVLQSPLAANGSITLSGTNYTITGTNSGSINICGTIFAVRGVAAGGELDSTNWGDCAQTNFVGGGTTSVTEFKQLETENNSYFSNGMFYFDISAIGSTSNRLNYDLVNVAGQSIISGQLPINGNNVKDQVDIPSVPTGVYIMRMNDGKNFNATKKIMIAQ